MKVINLRFKTLEELQYFYAFIEHCEVNTPLPKLDNIINSILEQISHKIYMKLKNESFRPLKLKYYESMAIIILYENISLTAMPIFEKANLINKMTQIQKKLA